MRQQDNKKEFPFSDLLQAFDDLVNRSVKEIWGECSWDKGDRYRSGRRKIFVDELRNAGFDGLAVLRYSPPHNRLLPIRPLIVSSLDTRKHPEGLQEDLEVEYFRAWASDRERRIGQEGMGFLATFVYRYYESLMSSFGISEDLGTWDKCAGVFNERIREFLVPRGYSALLDAFDPQQWFMYQRKHKECLATVPQDWRKLTSRACGTITRLLRLDCPQGHHQACGQSISESLMDEGFVRHAIELRDFLNSISSHRSRYWWINEERWEKKYASLVHRLMGILSELESVNPPSNEIITYFTHSIDLFKNEIPDYRAIACRLTQEISLVWPCSAHSMRWKNRIGVPITSQGELIGILALGAGSDVRLNRNSAEYEDYEKLLTRMARLCEGLVLSSDRIAGDPALPLTEMHAKVNEQVKAISNGLNDLKGARNQVTDLDANLKSDLLTTKALIKIFPTALHPNNISMFGEEARSQPDESIRGSNPKLYKEQCLYQLVKDNIGEGTRDTHYERWLESLGFSTKAESNTAWVMGHLWHGTNEGEISSRLAFIMGKGWNGIFWERVIGAYWRMPESLRNMFFERVEIRKDDRSLEESIQPNYQPFSMWVLDSPSKTDSAVAPLLFPVSHVGSTEHSPQHKTYVQQSLAYGDSTIVLFRQQLWRFPWGDRVRKLAHDLKLTEKIAVPIKLHEWRILREEVRNFRDSDGPSDEWMYARDLLAAKVLYSCLPDAVMERERAEAWRDLETRLRDGALSDEEALGTLRSIGWQLFENVGLGKDLAEGQRQGDPLRFAYDKFHMMFANLKTDDFVGELPGPEEHQAGEKFVSYLLMNIIMWEYRFLYFFPASTGVRKPAGGIICSLDRPLSDAEFEAFQRCTEEIFLPAYEFEDRIRRENAARESERVDSAAGLMHNLRNVIGPMASGAEQILRYCDDILDADFLSDPQHFDALELPYRAQYWKDRWSQLAPKVSGMRITGEYSRASVNAFYDFLLMGRSARLEVSDAGQLFSKSLAVAREIARHYQLQDTPPAFMLREGWSKAWMRAKDEWQHVWQNESYEPVTLCLDDHKGQVGCAPILQLALVELIFNALKGSLSWWMQHFNNDSCYEVSLELKMFESEAHFIVKNRADKPAYEYVRDQLEQLGSLGVKTTASGLRGAIQIARGAGAIVKPVEYDATTNSIMVTLVASLISGPTVGG